MSSKDKKRMKGGKEAIGFGSVLAMIMSWSANKAIGWAILHGIFSWFYVIYYLFTHHDWKWF
ncbi:MAG: hypothetical protein KDC35_14475 [Acidobacteria bacterium]|nr:hypothetical protein [Acidobacteriota bacterium]